MQLIFWDFAQLYGGFSQIGSASPDMPKVNPAIPAIGNATLNWIITIFLGFLALVFTIRTSSAGALIIAVLGALFVWFHWYTLGWSTIIISIVVAVAAFWKEKSDE